MRRLLDFASLALRKRIMETPTPSKGWTIESMAEHVRESPLVVRTLLERTREDDAAFGFRWMRVKYDGDYHELRLFVDRKKIEA